MVFTIPFLLCYPHRFYTHSKKQTDVFNFIQKIKCVIAGLTRNPLATRPRGKPAVNLIGYWDDDNLYRQHRFQFKKTN